MVLANPADGDFSDVEIFSSRGAAGEAAEHGQLADVGEGVGDGALEEALDGGVERSVGGQVGIEGLEGGEEALLLLRPGERLGVVPGLRAYGDGKRPVKKVAHVGQDLGGKTAGAGETGKVLGRVLEGTGSAVGERCNGVAQELAFFVHDRNIAQADARRGG